MEQSRQTLLDQLVSAAQSLSTDKLLEALDFVGYLRYQASHASRPERGSAQALLSHFGTFRFGSGELNQLLADIAQMRALDMESHA